MKHVLNKILNITVWCHGDYLVQSDLIKSQCGMREFPRKISEIFAKVEHEFSSLSPLLNNITLFIVSFQSTKPILHRLKQHSTFISGSSFQIQNFSNGAQSKLKPEDNYSRIFRNLRCTLFRFSVRDVDKLIFLIALKHK